MVSKARNNHSLLYKEELLASRLQELEPITSMKQSLSSLDHRLSRVGEAGDFSGFMNVYAELLDAELKLAGQQGAYASYYDEIAAFYGIPDDVKRIFLQFIGLFNRQADELLEEQQYDDNSFKWNLLRIPDSFYGGEKQKNDKLLRLFQRYDEMVLTRLAGAGQYTDLLSWSQSMGSEYANRTISAAWLNSKTDELVYTMLQRMSSESGPPILLRTPWGIMTTWNGTSGRTRKSWRIFRIRSIGGSQRLMGWYKVRTTRKR